MHSTMMIPGFEGVEVRKTEERDGCLYLHVQMPKKTHVCPSCRARTRRVHDYRVQKVQHLKWFERLTHLFYRKRRYACACGKKFAEQNSLVERYQRHSKEWNQAFGFRLIHGKNFKDTAHLFHTSPNTAVRRFDRISASHLKEVEELPRVIAIDEYKGDTDRGKYQVIIANADTGEPIDILPDRSAETVKDYLKKKKSNVECVVMDMSYAFKSAVNKALNNPIIVADRFHFCRYINWAVDRVRKRVQKDFHDYDRRKCKRMRHVFHKPYESLSDKQRWYLKRYLHLSSELKVAYRLKEAYQTWFEIAKRGEIKQVKEDLYAFYDLVASSGMKEFMAAVDTFRNWQTEIMNSFMFDYSNGFVEGLNNQTKVLKRNAFGFRRHDRLRARILMHHQFKHVGKNIG
ncbi:ISL3 family transposase [Salimicrobium salexigens]|uniref:Transposase n=1 Tax=Salimicrobium salexigens TaxID=908941 RepID=A0ABY1KZF5_9BACI|nr:ISL3 family transposase [Salimicrobium salexigens]SIS97523.1 Transposase [Salimicrobium salexigens]